jgi:hypothetical protein
VIFAHYHNVVRRLVLPAACAIAVAAAVEISMQLTFHPSFWQKTTWLQYDLFGGELLDRVFLSIRLSHLEGSDPDVISVGDSSGFFSLQSAVVNRYLGGRKYLSLNTGGNHAYLGYQAIAEYMLRHSKHIKYVVLYVFPVYLPQEYFIRHADLSPITYNDLVGARSYLTPPSAYFSPHAKFGLFRGLPFRHGQQLTDHIAALQLADTVDDALGWLPEFDIRHARSEQRQPFFSDERPGWYQQLGETLGLADPSSINANLDAFDRMVRSYGARLVIAFAPLARHIAQPIDPNFAVAEAAFARFQREHPDVKFLFPLLTEWSPEKFGSENHVSREYTFLSSERMGKALQRLLRDPDSIPPFQTQAETPPQPAVTATSIGPEDPNLLAPALALYLYTSTDDEKYRTLISDRVRELLAREPAYQYAMADEHARAVSQARRGVKIGFDLSQMHARPVKLEGISHCGPVAGQTVQWVQLYGVMIFTFQSATAASTAAMRWPVESGIYVPTVIEDGVLKFDGYCPEPSMADASASSQ